MRLEDLYARDKGVCGICGREVRKDRPSTWTRDHIVPKSKGGPGTDGNIRLAHWRCNQLKSDKE